MSLVGAVGGVSPQSCVVLVPVATHIEPDCERALLQLEMRGYVVRRAYGHAAIDQARSQMASDALADGFDELMWVDSDIGFDPDAVDRLRAHGLPMVCAIYPKKGQAMLACNLLPGTESVTFGEGGGLLEIGYAATGFLLTRREVYEDVARHGRLPVCNARFGRPMVPYFLPMLVPDGPPGDPQQHWYLGEDFAFSERARLAGHRIMADTTIRLFHIGRYGYSWEEAGAVKPRYARFDFKVNR
jgi:hypothetical protein